MATVDSKIAEQNHIDGVHSNSNGQPQDSDSKVDDYKNTWGFTIEELYKLALKFYKEKEGSKALKIHYPDKLRLVAYTKQATYGKYRADVLPDVGLFDVIGNDRRQAWQLLGDMSPVTAMEEFFRHLNKLSPLLKVYIEAHRAEKLEQERILREEEMKKRQEEEEREKQHLENLKREQDKIQQHQQQQEMQIRNALNQQTALQFQQYAKQQFPGSPEQQEILIKQLQEQHFKQYIQQVYQQQLLHQQQQFQQLQTMTSSSGASSNPSVGMMPITASSSGTAVSKGSQLQTSPEPSLLIREGSAKPLATDERIVPNGGGQVTRENGEDGRESGENGAHVHISAPSMWTRKDIQVFKESLRKDPDSIIKVGSGETVTVRVPTHEDGTCLFWEFASDSYDIGFGVYFEWTIATNNQVTVQVSESSDEEDLEGDASVAEKKETATEKGAKKKDDQPPTDEIIPVYRRDCHDEVYCGSHMYPGHGVYLLKFDNSYSLWRSKTIYYRVYYTR